MSGSFVRALLRQSYRWILGRISDECQEGELKRSAVVFSPHFDDETLGCGGTIIKKKRVGADVKIVFMTDGSKSHRRLISGNELRVIRAKEGLAASGSLGLNECDVFSLEFEETKLSEHQDSAANKVIEILVRQQPKEIFIPYYNEPLLWSKDHLATHGIVMSALQMYKTKVTIYEYPIWFWQHWPWVSASRRREMFAVVKDSAVSGMRLLRDFRCSVYIGDVLELKRTALNQHKSQMTRLIPNSKWPTLSDVSNGEFLDCFFQDHEIFRRYCLPGQHSSTRPVNACSSVEAKS